MEISFGKTKLMVSGSKGEKPNSRVDKCAEVRQEGDDKFGVVFEI